MQPSKHKPNLSADERNSMAQWFIEALQEGKLPKGKIQEAASRFRLHRRSVYKVWTQVMDQRRRGMPVSLSSKKVGVTRQKVVKLDVEKMKKIEFENRNTIRKLGQALGISKTTVGRWKKEGVIKAYTNAIKPSLTDVNFLQRLKFCLAALRYDVEEETPIFKEMDNVIHADEKWFLMTKCKKRRYILPGEVEPYNSCQIKRFIIKVMFFCCVSRPLYDSNGVLLFDGKLGMWPFTKIEPAKRNSRNRAAGTMVTKPLESINKQVTKELLINQVIPAIKAKWPPNASKHIIIQWDNAPPHIKNNDPDFRAAASSDGFDIQLQFQPPNSPDTNINDLGWFASLDAVKTESSNKSVDELVKAVLTAYAELSEKKLDKLFLSLQNVMISMMTVRGHNNYKLPHLGKDKLERDGKLRRNLKVDIKLVRECIEYLQQIGMEDGFEGIVAQLEELLLL